VQSERVQESRGNGRFAFPVPSRLQTIPGVRLLELEVSEATDLGPRMRRIRLTGDALRDFAYQPGQDVMLVLSGGERALSRRYTIRGYDAASRTIELNIVTHDIHGPGAEWAMGTQPGDRVNGVGPRGKIVLDLAADWHLFLGDESAAPGALHMLEALPTSAQAQAYLEVSTPEDELATSAEPGRVNWLYRGDVPATSSTMLADELVSAELPEGRGRVYIAGEVQIVNAIVRVALGRGLEADQLSPKAYWGRGKSNELNWEPGDRAVV
jgi:NADPH-dependent ferric siderophore reductase